MTSDEPRRAGWVSPTATLSGTAESAAGNPDGFSLWLVRGSLSPGATLTWDEHHGDEIVYVQRGELRVRRTGDGGPDGDDDRVCPEGGAVVVEAGVPAQVVAERGADVLHFGPADPDPPRHGLAGPSAPGVHVHVVGPGGTWSQIDDIRDTRYYADSTCETCRATLLFTSRVTPAGEFYESPAHSHSQDELIHVLYGELQLGAMTVRPGDTLALAGDVRYKFRAPAPGFGFLNYRRDASMMTIERDAPPFLEGGEVNGFDAVMDLR